MTESKDQIVIANEFAHVTVARLSSAEGDCILVSAPKRERVAQLDARTLWTLAGQPHSSVLGDHRRGTYRIRGALT